MGEANWSEKNKTDLSLKMSNKNSILLVNQM